MNKFILASQSPRREKILKDAGFIISVDHVKVSEIINENLNVSKNVEALARQKAEAYVKAFKSIEPIDFLSLSADTLVNFKSKPIGKPKNEIEAKKILRLLSGNTHSVVTGLCFYESISGCFFSASEETKIKFINLSEQMISDYIRTGESKGKAGAYAIQGEGRAFVESIYGSLSNVIGLPLELVEKIIKERSWNVPRK